MRSLLATGQARAPVLRHALAPDACPGLYQTDCGGLNLTPREPRPDAPGEREGERERGEHPQAARPRARSPAAEARIDAERRGDERTAHESRGVRDVVGAVAREARGEPGAGEVEHGGGE